MSDSKKGKNTRARAKAKTPSQKFVDVLKSKRFGIALAAIELVLSLILIGMLMYLKIL